MSGPITGEMRLVATEPGARELAAHAQAENTLRMVVGESARAWAQAAGWPLPALGFTGDFLAKLLENDANFREAVKYGGIDIWIPVRYGRGHDMKE